MFQVKENECVGFESRWQVKKISIEGSAQTSDFHTNEIATNTTSVSEIQTQTDAPETTQPKYDEEKLAQWLKKIYPNMQRELDDATTSQAFKNYHPSLDKLDINAKLIKKINVKISGNEDSLVSALSWNSTGNTLGVTCSQSHKTWCHHSGVVSLYSYDRHDELDDIPQKKLHAQSCLTSIRFHPSLPSVIAGGTFSGEIVIWNTQNDDNNNVVTKVNGHEEAVTQISWINDVDSAKLVLLATSSLDGFLILWNFNASSGSLKIKEKYKIRAPIFSKIHRKTETPVHIAKKVDRGIIAFDFSKFVAHMFVVAAEGGLVVQCSLLGTKPLKGSTKDSPISDPVYKFYGSHEGELTSITFSPNRRELFATNGTDGEIRIYMIEQEEPAQIIYVENQVHLASWVPYEEKLLAACGSKGSLEIFDVKKGKPIAYSADDADDSAVLCAMDINAKRITTVALGTTNGILQLWTIPWNVHSQNIK